MRPDNFCSIVDVKGTDLLIRVPSAPAADLPAVCDSHAHRVTADPRGQQRKITHRWQLLVQIQQRILR